ncbi:hypothetical protein M569_12135 [Genlisea aurea]|uniref:RanBP2-type domain-containing protein n=1 Tax=Genlisea aurea TaxID=192259 RepID=S8C7A0_9LAMI|nr:hypothetical protein M569_12135 [Genlisea aurea]
MLQSDLPEEEGWMNLPPLKRYRVELLDFLLYFSDLTVNPHSFAAALHEMNEKVTKKKTLDRSLGGGEVNGQLKCETWLLIIGWSVADRACQDSGSLSSLRILTCIHGRVSTASLLDNPAVQFCFSEDRESKSSKEVSHPWPEWVALMEKLTQKGYFDQIGRNPFPENGGRNKEANSIRTACLNFARHHYQFISHLSKKDILVIAASGCPSTDRKVVNSGKRLRSHLGIEEGNVCSSCALRGDCDRAYVKAREEEGGRTVDVMRLLLTYALDPVIGSVENKPCLNERVQESVRSLLKEMVEIRIDDIIPENASTGEIEGRGVSPKSNMPMKQGDWICPKCTFHNFARNYSCLRCDNVCQDRLKRIAEEHGHLPLKKGDWICDNCNLLNFAKNTRCYLCKGKPPKRELILGEWECVS